MEQGILEITASHSPLAFIYSLFKTNIVIDGQLERRPWGTHRFPVEPGQHVVEVSYPWLFTQRCGRNSVEVSVGPGQILRVHYHAPAIRYMAGTITVESPLPSARVVE